MQTEKKVNMTTTEEAIYEKNQIFRDAMAAGNAEMIANACYCEDAEFMAPGGPPFTGRQDIQSALAGFIQQGFTEYTILSTDIYNETGIVGVQSHYLLSKSDGSDQDNGKAIQLWKEELGEWKIFRDCFNSNLTP